LERLEDRTLLSVTIAPTNNSGNGYTGLTIDQDLGIFTEPPDSNGAAGPSSYVETVNQTVAVFSPKATGAGTVSDNLAHFFGTTGGLLPADSAAVYTDPGVIYDDNVPGATPTTGRFIVTENTVDTAGASVFDIAISKSAIPATLTTADWSFYQISTTEAGGLWADYPGNLGYNQDALVVTFDMRPTVQHVQVDAVSISDMVNGVPKSQLRHTQADLDASVRPATEHDAASGAPEWLVAPTGDGVHISVYEMTNLLTSPSFALPPPLAVTPAFGGVAPPLQPDGSSITGIITSRIEKAAESNNTIVAAIALSGSSTQDVIQWYKIDVSSGTPVLSDEGLVDAGPNTYLVYPAIDINSSGDIGLTYTRSGTDSATDFMSACVTGRTSSDPAGTMEMPIIVPAGTGTVNDTRDGREGDLSGISVDPVDGSFWAATEFATPSTVFHQGSWGTSIANFRPGSADLAVTNSGPSTAAEGDGNLTYTLQVTNNGPDPAHETVLTDALPANLKFVLGSTGQGSFTNSGGTVTFNMGTLAAGQTVTATVTAQATEDGALTDSASVTSNTGDPNPGNNAASATTVVTEPPIIVSGSSITVTAKTVTNITVATFTHASGVEPASAFVASINWGDGNSKHPDVTGGTITLSGGIYTVTGSHTYKSKLAHTVTTTVTEAGSAPNTATAAALVLSLIPGGPNVPDPMTHGPGFGQMDLRGFATSGADAGTSVSDRHHSLVAQRSANSGVLPRDGTSIFDSTIDLSLFGDVLLRGEAEELVNGKKRGD
jgi:uncharacterized repeat protein (TIGR01451 family)